MILEIPKNAETILHILENAGYEAYEWADVSAILSWDEKPDDWILLHLRSLSRLRNCFTEQWIQVCSTEP